MLEQPPSLRGSLKRCPDLGVKGEGRGGARLQQDTSEALRLGGGRGLECDFP